MALLFCGFLLSGCDTFVFAYDYAGAAPDAVDVPDGGVIDTGSTLDFSRTARLATEWQFTFQLPVRDIVGTYADAVITYQASGIQAKQVGLLDSSAHTVADVVMAERVLRVVADDIHAFPFVIESDRVEALNLLTRRPEASWMAPAALSSDTVAAFDGESLLVVTGTQATRLSYDAFAADRHVVADPPFSLPFPATAIAAGGGLLYVLSADGVLHAIDAGAGHAARGSVQIGPVKFVVRGAYVFVAHAEGLRLYDFDDADQPKLVTTWPQFRDAFGLTLQGPMLVVFRNTSAGDRVAIMDVADPLAPIPQGHVEASTDGSDDFTWGTLADHAAIRGSATQLSALRHGIGYLTGPLVAAPLADAVSLYATIPLRKSWSEARVDALTLRCGPSSTQLSPVAGTVGDPLGDSQGGFQPAALLPQDKVCAVFDGGATFHTSKVIPVDVTNATLAVAPVVDGTLGASEWQGVTPVDGTLLRLRVATSAGRLYLAGDWVNVPNRIDPTCGFRTRVVTGDGATVWGVDLESSGHVEATKNGEKQAPSASTVEAAAGHASTPLLARRHPVFELSLPAEPGPFGLQVQGPGPAHDCALLEIDPMAWCGTLGADGAVTLEANSRVSSPAAPELLSPAADVEVDARSTFTITRKDSWRDFATAAVEFLSCPGGVCGDEVHWAVPVDRDAVTLLDGILEPGTKYRWRATVANTAGKSSSAPRGFVTR